MMDDLISRRDAINAVSEITTTMSVCTNKDECYGMKRMQKQAITELANLPSTINVVNMDDCISRTQAIDTLDVGAELLRRVLDDMDVVGVERAKYEWGLGLIESYISDMKELPSAQPERPKGEWIHQAKFGRIECDQCGKVFRNSFVPKNFCPNCGADMRGEQNG